MELVQALFILLPIAALYGAMIFHVARSPRTPSSMTVFWIVAIVLGGVFSYAAWWMMSPKPPAAESFGKIVPQEGKAVIKLGRSSFFGALVKYKIFLDDKTVLLAEIRGKGSQTVAIEPGKHTLWVYGWRWLEFPFEAHAGDVLAFSLDTKTETPLTNTVAGWVAVTAGTPRA